MENNASLRPAAAIKALLEAMHGRRAEVTEDNASAGKYSRKVRRRAIPKSRLVADTLSVNTQVDGGQLGYFWHPGAIFGTGYFLLLAPL